MLVSLVTRLFTSIPVLFGLSLLAFLLVRLIPGDPATVILGLRYSPEAAASLRSELGLDRSLAIQYWLWLQNALSGDFGQSAVSGTPVLSEIKSRLGLTFKLALMALGLGSSLGLLLGIALAVVHNRYLQAAGKFFAVIGVSIPNFWLASLLILIVSLQLGWLPSGAYVPWSENPRAHIQSLILPALSLALAVMAVISRMTQAAMAEVMAKTYIQTAIAKGLGRWQVVFGHAMRNALAPVVTLIGLQAGSLLGGSIVIEQVFALPGFGQLVLQSVGNRDYPMLQGIILCTGSVFILLNLVVDLIYRWLDPRLEESS